MSGGRAFRFGARTVELQFARALFVGRADDGSKKRYRFRASTTGAARDGMVIPADEWRTDNYLRNPVVLLSHDYWSMPIGRSVELATDDEGLIATIEYDDGDSRAVDVMRKLDGGFMRAVSVGFRPARAEWPMKPGEVGTFRDVELLEISNVAVPSDPGALQMHMARGLMADGVTPSPDIEERLAALAAQLESVEDRIARLDRAGSAPATEPLIDIDNLTALKTWRLG